MARRSIAPGSIAFGLLLFGLATAARAHMPYLLPNAFHVAQRDHVAVVGSFSEALFVADVVLNSDNYLVRTPDGQQLPIDAVSYLKDLAALEVAVPDSGTVTADSQGKVSFTLPPAASISP